MVLALFIVVRDALIAVALGWIGVTLAPVERPAPEPAGGHCAVASSCVETARPTFGGDDCLLR